MKKFLQKKISFVRTNCKGQALVFYGLLIAVIFLFVGAAGDFGWYYLNQSRLQNAADSAVIAVAQTAIKREGDFSDYIEAQVISNNDSDLQRLISTQVVNTRRTVANETKRAIEYVALNLASDGKLAKVKGTDGKTQEVIMDGWNSDAVVTPTVKLYGKDEEKYGALYYVLTLDETIDHLFGITKAYGELPIQATAVVKILYAEPDPDVEPVDGEGGTTVQHGPSLYSQMREREKQKTYATWDHIKAEYDKLSVSEYKPTLGVGNSQDAAKSRSVQSAGNWYYEGNVYRTETSVLHGESMAVQGGGNRVTPAKDSKIVDQTKLDNLFIDFKVDMVASSDKWSKDWDLGQPNKPSDANLLKGSYNYGDKKDTEYRIHALINVGRWHPVEATDTTYSEEIREKGGYYTYPYKVRENREYPDPLYAYIENENIYSHEHQNGNTGINSVRQIIINVNVSNTANDERPLIIFYDGPETVAGKTKDTWNETWREGWKYDDYKTNLRRSLPVILNLNADFKGVLFAPNSPVVINGNGHSLQGFVVAKSYVKLKTAADFEPTAEINGENYTKSANSPAGKIIYVNDLDSTKTYTYTLITEEKTSMLKDVFDDYEQATVKINPMWVDEMGNVQYQMSNVQELDEINPTQGWANGGTAKPLDPEHGDEKAFKLSDFNLSSTQYDSFYLVALVNYTYLNSDSADNIFITDRSDWID